MRLLSLTLCFSLFCLECADHAANCPAAADGSGNGDASGADGDVSDGEGSLSSCPAANPNDDMPDDLSLQTCLNQGGTIALEPGNPGYIIYFGLTLTRDNMVLTSAAPPTRAKLLASPWLVRPLLEVVNRKGIVVSFIEFDGNRPNRSGLEGCREETVRSVGPNLRFAFSSDFHFTDNRSTRAMCGSAASFMGSDFEVARNLIDDNGHGREDIDVPWAWSDGITLALCEDGYVHDNEIVDATDVGIVTGGGQRCRIENNVVSQVNRHSFCGIQLGFFTWPGAEGVAGEGDQRGSLVTGNEIGGYPGGMSFGIGVGAHPWKPDTTVRGGTVRENTVSGAVVNLFVDGVDGATVTGNTLSSPSGTPQCGGPPTNYTVSEAHVTDSTLDPGWVSRDYDNCIP